MSWFRRSSSKSPSRPAALDKAGGTHADSIEAMLGLFLHEPEILLTDVPDGERSREMASTALLRRGKRTLAPNAPVKLLVAGDTEDPAQAMSLGTPRTPADCPSIEEQEHSARRDAALMTGDLLEQAGRSRDEYSMDQWIEEASPTVKVFWTAAKPAMSQHDGPPAEVPCSYLPHRHSGTCDVCGSPFDAGEALEVRTTLYWSSKNYKEWVAANPETKLLLKIQGWSVDDYITIGSRKDTTMYSVVCTECIHLFE